MIRQRIEYRLRYIGKYEFIHDRVTPYLENKVAFSKREALRMRRTATFYRDELTEEDLEIYPKAALYIHDRWITRYLRNLKTVIRTNEVVSALLWMMLFAAVIAAAVYGVAALIGQPQPISKDVLWLLSLPVGLILVGWFLSATLDMEPAKDVRVER